MTRAEKKGYSIGQVSKKFHFSQKMLRYYDEIGLLCPSVRDEKSGYRYYTRDDIGKLLTIKYYQESKLSLAAIKQFLEVKDNPEMIALFKENIEAQNKEIERLTIARDSLLAWQKLIEEGHGYLQQRNNTISIKKMPLLHTISAGSLIDSPYTIGDGYLRYKALATEQVAYGAAYAEFASYEKRLRYEEQPSIRHMEIHPLCLGAIENSELGGCFVVSAIHLGTGDRLAATYKKALQWADENALSLAGTSIERYVIDNASTSDKSRHVFEVMLPIEES